MVYIYKGDNTYEYISIQKIMFNILLVILAFLLLIYSSILVSRTSSHILLEILDIKITNLELDVYVNYANITIKVCDTSDGSNGIQPLFYINCYPINLEKSSQFSINLTSTFWILSNDHNIYIENPYTQIRSNVLYILLSLSSTILLFYIFRLIYHIYYVYFDTCFHNRYKKYYYNSLIP